MNRPIKPRKPSEKDRPPQEYVQHRKYLAVKGDDVILTDDTYLFGYLTSNMFPLNKKQISKFIALLKDADEIDIAYDGYDGYDMNDMDTRFVVKKTEKNENYAVELEKYNKRFETYDKDLDAYNENLKKYKNWRKKLKEDKEKVNEELKNSIRAKLTPEEIRFMKNGGRCIV